MRLNTILLISLTIVVLLAAGALWVVGGWAPAATFIGMYMVGTGIGLIVRAILEKKPETSKPSSFTKPFKVDDNFDLVDLDF